MPFAQLTNSNLHYYELGAGPQRVVLIHGFEASARIWQLVQEDLSPEQYHTIAIDNRGAGESSAPDDANDYGVGIFASDALELIDQLGWSDFTLVGHSLGRATACIMALQRPELVKGLMLLDPVDPDGRTETPEEIDVFFDACATQTMPVLVACGDADDTIPIAAMLATWAKFPKGHRATRMARRG